MFLEFLNQFYHLNRLQLVCEILVLFQGDSDTVVQLREFGPPKCTCSFFAPYEMCEFNNCYYPQNVECKFLYSGGPKTKTFSMSNN